MSSSRCWQKFLMQTTQSGHVSWILALLVSCTLFSASGRTLCSTASRIEGWSTGQMQAAAGHALHWIVMQRAVLAGQQRASCCFLSCCMGWLPTDDAMPVMVGLQPPSAWRVLKYSVPCDELRTVLTVPVGSRLDGERFLVAVNLHNNEAVLPHQILQLIQVTVLELTHCGCALHTSRPASAARRLHLQCLHVLQPVIARQRHWQPCCTLAVCISLVSHPGQQRLKGSSCPSLLPAADGHAALWGHRALHLREWQP